MEGGLTMGLRLCKPVHFRGRWAKGEPVGGSATESIAKGEAKGVQFRSWTQTQDPRQRQDLLLGGVREEEKLDKT